MGLYMSKFYMTLFWFILGLMVSLMKLICSSKLMMFWVLLEIKLFMFINIMMSNNCMKKFGDYNIKVMSPMMIYFLFQSLGSGMFLLGLSVKSSWFLMLLSLLMKIGIFPFFWWVVEVGNHLKLYSLWVFLSINKMSLFYALFWFLGSSKDMFYLLMMKGLIALFGMVVKVSNMKLLLIYSSLLDTSYMMFLSQVSMEVSIMYFVVYSLLLGLLILNLWFLKCSLGINQVLNNKSSLEFLIINLLGLPPFLGFYYKFYFLMSTVGVLKVSVPMNMMGLLFFMGMFVQCMMYFMFFMKQMKLYIFKVSLLKLSEYQSSLLLMILVSLFPMFVLLV